MAVKNKKITSAEQIMTTEETKLNHKHGIKL
jgi:hypothetical protein